VIILIDSDILIEISRGRNEDALAKWALLQDSDSVLLCSPVTVAELWHGARPSEHKSLDDLFAALVCVPIDQDVGRRAGDYLRQFAKSHNLELGDAFIAATALTHGAALWTRNRKHYPVKDLTFY
jgi:predicted nucleic acid-binding protein